MASQTNLLSRSEMVKYSVGECANSLLMNSLFGFAMLYYTDALGLQHSLAGIAMSVAVFWDAVTDPVMGHITDSTRSRYGRRHPYILLGGIVVTMAFILLWYVPGVVRADSLALFWYLVVVNLLQRTAITVFAIPYVALGFEMCTDYEGRVRLQGIRSAMNMVANLLGTGLVNLLLKQRPREGNIAPGELLAHGADVCDCLAALHSVCRRGNQKIHP
jgi:GPH family glycoside/pentoside/hexuronide:cation symporter